MIKLTEKEIETNNKNYNNIKKDIKQYSQRIVPLAKEDAALAGIYALQIGQKQTQLIEIQKFISELEQKKQEFKLSIVPPMLKTTHIIGDVETPSGPIKPKKKLIIIVAFITGLMLSVFLAFFLEFLAGMKDGK